MEQEVKYPTPPSAVQRRVDWAEQDLQKSLLRTRGKDVQPWAILWYACKEKEVEMSWANVGKLTRGDIREAVKFYPDEDLDNICEWALKNDGKY